MTNEQKELLIEVIGTGLTNRRRKAKANLLEATKQEDKLLIDVYLKQIEKIDALHDQFEDALENNILLIESIREETKLLN